MRTPPSARRSPRAVLLCLLFLIAPDAARSADLDRTGELALCSGRGESGGSSAFFSSRSDDSNSSPACGGSFGFAVPLQAIPWRFEEQFELPDWTARVEIQALGGRDYELQASSTDGVLSEVESFAVMNSVWMDFPLDTRISKLFGRTPALDPLSFTAGAGVGVAANDVATRDNLSHGVRGRYGIAWQAGAGLGYAFARRVNFGLGYRYIDLGEVDFGLRAGNTPVGDFSRDLRAHEVATTLRVDFYSLPVGGP